MTDPSEGVDSGSEKTFNQMKSDGVEHQVNTFPITQEPQLPTANIGKAKKLIIRTLKKEDTDAVIRKIKIEPKKYSHGNTVQKEVYYEGMPRFVQNRYRPDGEFHYISSNSPDELSEIFDQKITNKTKSIWYPKKERGLGDWAWLDTSGLKPRSRIYIISKSRPQCITAKALSKMGADFKIVVENSELEEYKNIWGDHVITGDFDTTTRSSIPVRNFVHELCPDPNYWLMDDNIEDFNLLTDNQKYVCRTPVIFRAAEDFFGRFENVGQAGFNYYSFAKKTESVPPYYVNTRIYSCTYMYKNLQGVDVDGKYWRGRYNEDTDLSLRILKAGYCTILMNHFLAGKVTTQRNKGGNTDSVYTDNDNRFRFAESLRSQHPDCVKITKKFGRWHHNVNYRDFRQKLKTIDNIKHYDYGLYLDSSARKVSPNAIRVTP